EGAVFVDVTGAPTHVLYARALAADNAHAKAAYELETALLGKLDDKQKASAHALLAKSYAALKKPADAKKHLDEALKLDPDNADAKDVKLP
ncbi:MAG TPA: tetratricopeptide repeat protein, partial [Labilithrix sp.]